MITTWCFFINFEFAIFLFSLVFIFSWCFSPTATKLWNTIFLIYAFFYFLIRNFNINFPYVFPSDISSCIICWTFVCCSIVCLYVKYNHAQSWLVFLLRIYRTLRCFSSKRCWKKQNKYNTLLNFQLTNSNK